MYVLGRPVCDQNWNDNNAKVVCRTLGYSEATKATAWRSGKWGATMLKFLMTNVRCNGTEKHLGECQHVIINFCFSTNVAGVTCLDPQTTELRQGIQNYQGNVYISESPVCNDGWNALNSNVVCKQLFGEGFKSMQSTLSNPHSTVQRFIMTNVRCMGNESDITDCKHTLLGSCPSKSIAQVHCQGCSSQELLEVFKNLKFSGTSDDIREALNNTMKAFQSACGRWNCTGTDKPKDYCALHSFLTEAMSYMGNENNKYTIANLQTRINYRGLLQHNFFAKKFADVHNDITKLGDRFGKTQKELAEYFRNLAVFDKEKAKVDLKSAHVTLNMAIYNIKKIQKQVQDDLAFIINSVFKQIKIDQSSLVSHFTLQVVLQVNPLTWLFRDPSSIGSAIVEIQKHVVTNKHLQLALGRALPRMESVATVVVANTNKNKVVYRNIESIFNSTKDFNLQKEDSHKFLEAYSTFKPVVSDAQLADYASAMKHLVDMSCDLLLNPQSVLGFNQALKEATEGRCPRIKSKLEQVKIMYVKLAEVQKQILNTFATIARASIAENGAESLVHVLNTNLQNQLERNITQWRSLLLLRFHKVMLIQNLCDYIFYMNHGEEDQVCKKMRANPDNDPALLIHYNQDKDMCDCNTCHTRSAFVSIPTKVSESSNINPIQGAVNFVTLLNETDKNGGSSTFQIPGSQWLVEHGWIIPSEKAQGPFFLKSLDVFLPPSYSVHKYRVHTTLSLLENKLNNRLFKFQDGLQITSTYNENQGGHCSQRIDHPYNIPYCKKYLKPICLNNQGSLKGPLYPLLTANWKIVLDSPVRKIIPCSTTMFYLKAKVEFCWKSKNVAYIQTMKQPQTNTSCCHQKDMYFDQKIDMLASGKDPCKACPTGSTSRLHGYYCETCLPGYQLDEKWYGCTPCMKGTYKKNIGINKCIKCPVGTTTTHLGQSKCKTT